MGRGDKRVMSIKKMLRYRLQKRSNPEYLAWFDKNKKIKKGNHKAHLIGRGNDLLLVDKDFHEHIELEHFEGIQDFETDLIEALENIFDYVEYLQQKK